MIELGPATEEEAVLAFLRAEIESSRNQEPIFEKLDELGYGREVIDSPDLADEGQNQVRRQLLQFRGYCERRELFEGFPPDVRWRKVILEPKDFQTMRYLNDEHSGGNWSKLSDNTRLVTVGAHNYLRRPQNDELAHIDGIMEKIRNGVFFPEFITAEASDGSLILMEGHSRATAYVVERYTGQVEALIGSSPSMDEWAYY